MASDDTGVEVFYSELESAVIIIYICAVINDFIDNFETKGKQGRIILAQKMALASGAIKVIKWPAINKLFGG